MLLNRYGLRLPVSYYANLHTSYILKHTFSFTTCIMDEWGQEQSEMTPLFPSLNQQSNYCHPRSLSSCRSDIPFHRV